MGSRKRVAALFVCFEGLFHVGKYLILNQNVWTGACGGVVFTSPLGFSGPSSLDDHIYEYWCWLQRHSLQAVELSQRTQAAVQIVSNLPAPSNGSPIYRFLALRTRWMAGAVAHKSGLCRDQSRSDNSKQESLDL